MPEARLRAFSRSASRRRSVTLGLIVLALLASVLSAVSAAPAAAQPAPATTFEVDSTADDGSGDCATVGEPCTLRSAIAEANAAAGSTVIVPAGTYALANGELDITAAMTIVGAADADPAGATIIDGGGTSRVFDVAATGVVISGVTVTGGSTNQTGGGIRVQSGAGLQLIDSLIDGNSAREGGGLDVDGTATVIGTTFVNNTADRKGGGFRADGTVTVLNSTFTQNVAQSGGGISVAGTADISFATFVDNTSNNSSGGGADRNGGTMTITNSILTQSSQSGSPGSDCSGTPDLVGVNIVGNASGCNPGPQVIVGQADLGPLADNGGPTPTIALLEGSIGVDAAIPCQAVDGTTVTLDQRSADRPGQAACDVGAFEIVPLSVDLQLGSVSPSGYAPGVVPVGAQTIPSANIPAAVNETQALFDGTLQASPLNAFPLNAVPLNAFPLNAFPLNAFPLNAFPLNAFFTAAAPLNAFQLNAFPLNAFPLDTVLLSDLVILEDLTITPPRQHGWDQILAGTPFEGTPLQALTLHDVKDDPQVQANLDTYEVDFGDLNLQGTPLNAFPLNAFLLPLPLNAFPLNAFAAAGSDADRVQAWCDLFGDFCSSAGIVVTDPTTYEDITLTTIALSGESLQSLDLTAAPLNAFFTQSAPLNAFPLNAFPLNAFNWVASPLNAFPLNAFPLNAFSGPDAFIDCSLLLPGGTCDGASLGDAADAGAFLGGSTFQDIADLAAANPGLFDGFGVADVLIGLIPPEAVPWEQIDLAVSGLQNAADPLEPPFQYEADVTLTAQADDLTIEIVVPNGFAYAPGSATFDGAPIGDPVLSLTDATDPDTCEAPGDTVGDDRVVLTFALSNVSTGGHTLSVDMRAGLVLDDYAASACAEASAGPESDSAVDGTTVTVVEATTAPGPNGAQLIQGDVVTLAHVSSSDDVDLYSFEVSAAQANLGIQAEIFLSNLPTDYDLTLYVAETDPLRGDPVDALTYLDDVVLDLNPFDDRVQADTVQDIPQALPSSVPNNDQFVVKAISSNRDTANELIETGTLRAGLYYVQVSAYNGAFSNEPYALRLRTTESLTRGPCAAITYPASGAGTAPAPNSLPGDVNTLFLVNEQLLAHSYGGAAASVLTKLGQVANSPQFGVVGAVIPVDSDADVRAAYQARFADPCKPLRSNDVVSAIGDLVDTYTAARPGIQNIVLVGDDRQIPMANIVDDANFANERVFSQNFIGNNESIAALVAGMYRTDDPYGTEAGIRVRDHELFVPERAVGRLVETPSEIESALDNFLNFGGRLDPSTTKTALQTGYEFLEDGAQLNVDNLEAAGYTVATLFGETWTASDLTAALQTQRDVVGIHAHFDQFNALPAFDNFNGQTDLFNVDDVPASVQRTVMYSMGCHSGYSDSDIQVGAPAPDWAQNLTGQASNLFAGNTGFGYGDSDKIALAELLTATFAEEVGQDGSIGQAWVDAKQRMLSEILVLDAYQEKTLMQFVFYGLPMFHVGVAPPDLTASPAALAAPATGAIDPDAITIDPATGLQTTTLSVNPVLNLTTTPDGSFYSADGTIDVNGRPIQPLARIDATAAGLRVKDAMITGLTSADDLGFDPLFFKSSTDFGQPRPEYLDGSFPAELVGVSSALIDGERRDQVLLAVGQFRGSPTTPDTGTQRLHTSVTTQVFYAPAGSTDITPPLIRRSAGFIGDGLVFFEIETDGIAGASPETRRVHVMFRDDGAVGAWTPVELTLNADGVWRGGRPFGGTDAEFFVQAVDDDGNVAMSDSKSLFFLTADPPAVGDLSMSASPAVPPSGWYSGPVTVTVLEGGTAAGAGDGITYRIDGGGVQAYTGPIPVSAPGAHLIEAFGPGGDFAVLYVAIDGTSPTVTATLDPDTNPDFGSQPVTVTVVADDGFASGLASITVVDTGTGNTVASETFGDPAPGSATLEFVWTDNGETVFEITATDVAGNPPTVVQQTVRIDTVGPDAPVLTRDPAGEWANVDVTVTIAPPAAADPSGIDELRYTTNGSDPDPETSATLPGTGGDVVVTDEGETVVSALAIDGAGNVGAIGATTVKIDKTAPTATVAPSAPTFVIGATTATATFGCQDPVSNGVSSGVATCQLTVTGPSGAVVLSSTTPPTVALPTAAAGTYTLRATATDTAGNVSTVAQATYSVGFNVCLQYDPTQPKNIGSVYAIRLRVCDAAGNNLSARTTVLTAVNPIGIFFANGNPVPGVSTPNFAGNSNQPFTFRYRNGDQSYIYNLDTTGMPAGSLVMRFTASTTGGFVYEAPFTLQ